MVSISGMHVVTWAMDVQLPFVNAGGIKFMTAMVMFID